MWLSLLLPSIAHPEYLWLDTSIGFRQAIISSSREQVSHHFQPPCLHNILALLRKSFRLVEAPLFNCYFLLNKLRCCLYLYTYCGNRDLRYLAFLVFREVVQNGLLYIKASKQWEKILFAEKAPNHEFHGMSRKYVSKNAGESSVCILKKGFYITGKAFINWTCIPKNIAIHEKGQNASIY